MERDAIKIREKFLRSAIDLHEKLKVGATAAITTLADDFKQEHLEDGGSVSDVAVDALQRFKNVLRWHKKFSTAFVFRHTETKQLRVVKIKEIKADAISIVEASVRVKKKLAINYNRISKQNYERKGITFPESPNDPPVWIKKRHIQLVAQKELRYVLEKQLLPIEMEYHFDNSLRRNKDFLENWLPRAVPGLIKCKVIKTYAANGALPRTNLALDFQPDKRPSEIIAFIHSLLNKQKSKARGASDRLPKGLALQVQRAP